MRHIILGPYQNSTFFYTGTHWSELQSCARLFSTNFILFSHLNSARYNLVIKLCRTLFFLNGYVVNWHTVL